MCCQMFLLTWSVDRVKLPRDRFSVTGWGKDWLLGGFVLSPDCAGGLLPRLYGQGGNLGVNATIRQGGGMLFSVLVQQELMCYLVRR